MIIACFEVLKLFPYLAIALRPDGGQ